MKWKVGDFLETEKHDIYRVTDVSQETATITAIWKDGHYVHSFEGCGGFHSGTLMPVVSEEGLRILGILRLDGKI